MRRGGAKEREEEGGEGQEFGSLYIHRGDGNLDVKRNETYLAFHFIRPIDQIPSSFFLPLYPPTCLTCLSIHLHLHLHLHAPRSVADTDTTRLNLPTEIRLPT